MFDVLSRSWEITKMSFDVIKKDKELLLFPFFASIFSILFLIAMLVPSIITSFIEEGVGPEAYGIVQYAVLFLTYLGLAFIATFFNVCVVYTVKIRFEGGNATFMESLKFALSKIGLIFYWSLISATVGLVLRIIDILAEKAGPAGQFILGILTMILGLMWSIITIFVVPAMVYHDLKPSDAIKKSVETLKKTWGESLVRYYGLGFIQAILLIMGIFGGILLLFVAQSLELPYAMLGMIGIIVLYVILVMLVFNVANGVFNTALYVYADTGSIPSGYSQDIMQNAFRKDKRR
ncbi:MAG: DUF6159 family protein [ANME-2 cluster archaeon]|nr:DUF6159 family protein [ANME-2 cluster archaeon]MDF1532793.1 DUF6159 family protein [ANME-2 cluster archaeon]